MLYSCLSCCHQDVPYQETTRGKSHPFLAIVNQCLHPLIPETAMCQQERCDLPVCRQDRTLLHQEWLPPVSDAACHAGPCHQELLPWPVGAARRCQPAECLRPNPKACHVSRLLQGGHQAHSCYGSCLAVRRLLPWCLEHRQHEHHWGDA